MDAQALTIVFVFVCNALVLAGLGWVVYHIQQSTEVMQSQLAVATKDLAETGRGLRGLGSGVDRMIERLAAAERQASSMMRATAESISAMDGQLRQSLQKALSELAASGELTDTTLHRDLRQLLESLDQVLPGATHQWADKHRQELELVMSQGEALTGGNDQLQGHLGDMREQLESLRAVQRAQQAADREIESLQASLSQQQQLAQRLRNEAREAGHQAGAAEAAAQQARTESHLAREDAERQALLAQQNAERARELEDELATLRRAHMRLETEHARQRDELQRLAREKEFIEDKYLGLDADAAAPADA